MYISENDLKHRILTGQIEVLNEVITDLRKEWEMDVMRGDGTIRDFSTKIIAQYSKWLKELKSERKELEQEK